MAPIGTVEAGWYSVGEDPNEQAYWDGRAWSIRRHRSGDTWSYESTKAHDESKVGRASSTRWGALALFAFLVVGAVAGGVFALARTNHPSAGGGTAQASNPPSQNSPQSGSGIKTLPNSSSATGAAAPPSCTISMASELDPPGGQAPYSLTSRSASQPYSVEVSGSGTAATYAHTTTASGDDSGSVPVPNVNVVNRYTVAVTFTGLSGSVSCSAYFYSAGN